MRFGQNIVVTNPAHPLFSRCGLVYRISGNRITVLFDKEVLYDFREEDLSLGEPRRNPGLPALIENLG